MKKKLVSRYIAFLPDSLAVSIINKNIDFTEKIDEKIIVKVADNISEFEQSFQQLHDAYVDEGFMKACPNGMRITYYHALPTTVTVVMKRGEEGMGTISIIKNSLSGFPSSKVLSLKEHFAPNDVVAEISSLAVKKEYRRESSLYFFTFIRYVTRYALSGLGIDYLIIAVHPRWQVFYEKIIGFKLIQGVSLDQYDFANDCPAIFLKLDLKRWHSFLYSKFAQRRASENMYFYMIENRDDGHFVFPQRKYDSCIDCVWKPDSLDYFFNKLSNVFDSSDILQKIHLRHIYSGSSFARVLPFVSQKDFHAKRQNFTRTHFRADVKFLAKIYFENSDTEFLVGDVKNVSRSGVGVVSREDAERLEVDLMYRLKIRVEDFEIVNIGVKLRSKGKGGLLGFEVVENLGDWCTMVDKILEKLVSSEQDDLLTA